RHEHPPEVVGHLGELPHENVSNPERGWDPCVLVGLGELRMQTTGDEVTEEVDYDTGVLPWPVVLAKVDSVLHEPADTLLCHLGVELVVPVDRSGVYALAVVPVRPDGDGRFRQRSARPRARLREPRRRR